MRYIVLFVLFFTFLNSIFSQASKKTYTALPTKIIPKIDGVLDDEIWKNTANVSEEHFIQYAPDAGEPSEFPTRFQIFYDDDALYVSAKMYDTHPDSIAREMGFRDSGKLNTDVFAIILDTYHKEQNAYVFMVSAAGVQTDMYITPIKEDRNWNAVWKSAVTIDDEGWNVEMEIPYTSLRFPKKEVQTWGFNPHRLIRRKNEESFWNYINPMVNGVANQFGKLEGLQNIKPSLRLSLSPYVSGYVNHDGETGAWNTEATGGMDLKLGLSESFTLDMTLIPDFGQVRADNVVLNLSPYEVKFSENRAFFTEGTELFNRNNLFYSRRVGKIFNSVDLFENEEAVDMPNEAALINATKVSGRTSKGLGIGVFNAVTDELSVMVKDTITGEERSVKVDPLTNFNAITIEQNLNNNSNIGFMNTNVYRGKDGRTANVTGTEFRFYDKESTYSVKGHLNVSAIGKVREQTGDLAVAGTKDWEWGYNMNLLVGKVAGTFQYWGWANIESDTYEPNDLGFMQQNNEVAYGFRVGYNRFKPFSVFNRMSLNLNIQQKRLYHPSEFTDFKLSMDGNTQLKNFWNLRGWIQLRPMDGYDYFDPREEGYFLLTQPSSDMGISLQTDKRRDLSVNALGWLWIQPSIEHFDNGGHVEASFRFNNRFSTSLRVGYKQVRNQRGYADTQEDTEGGINVLYGKRDVRQFTNLFKASYAFNSKMLVDLRLRHYWSVVSYDEFYDLIKDTGDVKPTAYNAFDNDGISEYDKNFNAFNLELNYRWEFAPSSFLSVVWKNQIQTESQDIYLSYGNNFGNVMDAHQWNSFSIKMIYFLDYYTVKKWMKDNK